MKNEKAKEAKAAAGGDQGGKKGGKGGQGRPQKARARDEIVPCERSGWEVWGAGCGWVVSRDSGVRAAPA